MDKANNTQPEPECKCKVVVPNPTIIHDYTCAWDIWNKEKKEAASKKIVFNRKTPAWSESSLAAIAAIQQQINDAILYAAWPKNMATWCQHNAMHIRSARLFKGEMECSNCGCCICAACFALPNWRSVPHCSDPNCTYTTI